MDIHDSRLKAGAAWGGVGISKFFEAFGIGSWGDLAAMLAAIYSLLLIGEWCVKKWRNRRKG
jgi:hypothetical protein